MTPALESRINALANAIPADVQQQLEPAADDEIAHHYAMKGKTHFHQVAAALRNDLSHGSSYKPESREIRPWVTKLDLLAKAHLLRLPKIRVSRAKAILCSQGTAENLEPLDHER